MREDETVTWPDEATPREAVSDPLVISLDDAGQANGAVPRSRAHRSPAVLHRAVSLQVVNPDGRWVVQCRADSKALFAGRWANTCCTHPLPGESSAQAALRRVRQELGVILMHRPVPAGTFTYRAVDPRTGLVEYERDEVFVVVASIGQVSADPAEVGEVAHLPFTQALRLVDSHEGAPWASEVLRRAAEILE